MDFEQAKQELEQQLGNIDWYQLGIQSDEVYGRAYGSYITNFSQKISDIDYSIYIQGFIDERYILNEIACYLGKTCKYYENEDEMTKQLRDNVRIPVINCKSI